MATFNDIKTDVGAVLEAVAAERVEVLAALAVQAGKIQALKDQLAQALPVTQSDLDDLDASVKALVTSVQGTITPEDTADPVVPAP